MGKFINKLPDAFDRIKGKVLRKILPCFGGNGTGSRHWCRHGFQSKRRYTNQLGADPFAGMECRQIWSVQAMFGT